SLVQMLKEELMSEHVYPLLTPPNNDPDAILVASSLDRNIQVFCRNEHAKGHHIKDTHDERDTVWIVETGKPAKRLGRYHRVNSVVFSSDEKLLLVAYNTPPTFFMGDAERDYFVQLWSVEDWSAFG